jgi:Heparinase II/III-like protein
MDGEDQAIPAGPFKWEKIPEVRVEHWWVGKSFDLFIASHTGYLRFASPVLHRRTVFFLKPQFWLIIDALEGEGEHSLELNWHVPDKPARLTSTALELGSPEHGKLGIVPILDPRWSVELMIGWHSACYGHKQSAPTLRCTARTVLPAEFATLLIPRLTTACGRLERISKDGVPGPRGFRYSTEMEQHSWILSDRSEAWQLGDLACDARLAYVGRKFREGRSRVVLWEGSFLSLQGVRVVNLHRRQGHLEQDWMEEGTSRTEGSLCVEDTSVAGLREPAR